MIASVDVGKLVELAVVAPLAAIAVALTFSLVVLGSTRAAEASRAGSNSLAFAYGALAVVAFAAFAGISVAGLLVIISK